MTREEATELLNQYNLYSPTKQIEEAIDMAIEALSAEAVEVVRCKECRHVEVEDEPFIGMWCTRFGSNDMAVWDNCFCSFGERREDGEV